MELVNAGTVQSSDDMGKLNIVEEKIGYFFDNQMLIKRALTHPSIMTQGDGRPFERLEFLGDRVLGLIIAELLFANFPDEWEGDLARRFSFLVRKETLIAVAGEMGLQAIMIVPEDKGTGIQKHYDTIWSDGCEALLGAIYLDGGLEPARTVICKFWESRMTASVNPPVDPKNALQEWSQGEGLELPTYTYVSRTGPDHAPEFIMEASLTLADGTIVTAQGAGPNKKAGEKEAAKEILARVAKAKP